ncbi:MAG: PAS domain S-box protein, partial [Actinobacteria bacterium]|nr:PAS domain S-box protein [Actinomycetota bacterium]
MAGARKVRRGVPIAIKLGGFVAGISLIGAALLGYVGVSTTGARIDSQYAAESRQLLDIITAQTKRHPQRFEETNALLENLVATHPTLARVRLFRGPPFGPPLVWASSYDTDVAVGTDDSILVPPGQQRQNETYLEGLPVFLDVLGVDYSNGVESVAFYYEGAPRTQAIAETRRRIITDSLIVIAIELAALIIATYLIVLRRVRRLGRAAALVAGGDLSTRVRAPRSEMARDELDDVAIEFGKMTDAVSLRTRQQQAVTNIGRQALSGTGLDQLRDYATRTVAEVMGTEYSLLFEKQDGSFLLRSAWGVPEGMVGVTTIPDDNRSHAGYTIKVEAPVLVPDRVNETRFALSEFARSLNLASGLTVIVRGAEGQVYGVLGADSTSQRVFSDDDVTFLQAVANVLAETMEREGALARERDAERRYRLIVENAADLILLTDLETHVLVASPSYGTILGYGPKELIGKPVSDLVAEPGGEEVAALQEARSGRTSSFRALALRHKDGREVLVDGTAAPIPGSDGRPALILTIALDVTEQLAAQEERRV